MSDQARELAVRLDKKLNQRFGFRADLLQQHLHDLRTFGKVEVGYRASCGKTDPTLFVHRDWVRVVKALRKDGVKVEEQPVKHGNRWATLAGGFWSSTIYLLPVAAAKGGAR